MRHCADQCGNCVSRANFCHILTSQPAPVSQDSTNSTSHMNKWWHLTCTSDPPEHHTQYALYDWMSSTNAKSLCMCWQAAVIKLNHVACLALFDMYQSVSRTHKVEPVSMSGAKYLCVCWQAVVIEIASSSVPGAVWFLAVSKHKSQSWASQHVRRQICVYSYKSSCHEHRPVSIAFGWAQVRKQNSQSWAIFCVSNLLCM